MVPKLSVIIPIYNTEQYIAECIESVINQTFKDYEIILVDDGSTDASGKICDEYAAKYEYISSIHKANGGAFNARMTGFYASKGAYISYIDSDDAISCDMYEYMLSKAEKHDADMVICDILRKTDTGNVLITNNLDAGFYGKAMLEEKIYPKLLSGGEGDFPAISPGLCNKIIKREILEDVLKNADGRAAEVKCGEDALCSVPCMLNSEGVYVCDRAFYYYRTVESSASHIFNRGRMREFILLIELFEREFERLGFDGKEQLYRYAARYSIEYLRSELLFDKESSLKERVEFVRQYVKNPTIANAVAAVLKNTFGNVNDIKIKLIKEERFYALYFIFYIKNMMINHKGFNVLLNKGDSCTYGKNAS